jgi:hypothetical protein
LRAFVFERAGKPFFHIVLRVPSIDKRYVFNDIKKEGEENMPLLELSGKTTLYRCYRHRLTLLAKRCDW